MLVERGDQQVCHSLARNAGARFSESGFAVIVKRSEGDEGLAEQLGLRLDIPMQLLQSLLAKATDLVRSRLLAAATTESQEKIRLALAGIVGEIRREAAVPRDFARSDDLVRELNRNGKLTEKVLVDFARGHKREEMMATLALFCGAKSELIERLLDNPSYEGIVVACKAAKLSWPTTALILETRFSHHSVTQAELDAAKAAFLELSQASAQRSVRFMQVQAVAKGSDKLRA